MKKNIIFDKSLYMYNGLEVAPDDETMAKLMMQKVKDMKEGKCKVYTFQEFKEMFHLQ